MRQTALITGITGQDGAYLARFLLGRGYHVHGMRPYAATDDTTERLGDLCGHSDFHLHHGDLSDSGNVIRLLRDIKPDEIYNLGAQSHVAVSFIQPEHTANINALGTLRLLEGICILDLRDHVRFYQASSSEMFGNATAPQNEETPFAPCSPYAAAKLYAYWITRTYRESYGVFASNGILFNHESPMRGQGFVSRKIAAAAARGESVALGNLDACRDWGHAADYVRGMWMIMQHSAPDDFVLATGQTRSVRDFANAAYASVGIKLQWQGNYIDERGICTDTGRVMVHVDPALFRPTDISCLCGDSTKAREILGWHPEILFDSLVRDMVASEMNLMDNRRGMRDAAE